MRRALHQQCPLAILQEFNRYNKGAGRRLRVQEPPSGNLGSPSCTSDYSTAHDWYMCLKTRHIYGILYTPRCTLPVAICCRSPRRRDTQRPSLRARMNIVASIIRGPHVVMRVEEIVSSATYVRVGRPHHSFLFSSTNVCCERCTHRATPLRQGHLSGYRAADSTPTPVRPLRGVRKGMKSRISKVCFLFLFFKGTPQLSGLPPRST